MDYAGSIYRVYENLIISIYDGSSYQEEPIVKGWCNPDYFKTDSASSVDADSLEAGASADQAVGTLFEMYTDQIKPYPNLTVFQLTDLANGGETDTYQEDLLEYYQDQNNVPMLVSVAILCLVLSMLGIWFYAYIMCCCGRNPKKYKEDNCMRKTYCLTTATLVLASVVLVGLSYLKGKEIMAGIPGVGCAVQNQIPLTFYGFNDVDNEITLSNSNFCFSNEIKYRAYESTKLFYHNRNRFSTLMADSGCDQWVTDFGTDFLDQIITLDEDLYTADEEQGQMIADAIEVIKNYDNKESYSELIVNPNTAYFGGIENTIDNVSDLAGMITDLSTDMTAIDNWDGYLNTNFDLTDTITNIQTLHQTTSSLTVGFASSYPINLYSNDLSTSYTITPVNVAKYSMLEEQMDGGDEQYSEQGYTIDYSASNSITILADQSVAVFYKTLLNCLMPLILSQKIAPKVVPYLDDLDIVQDIVDTVVDIYDDVAGDAAEYYYKIVENSDMDENNAYVNLPAAINVFALIVTLLILVGLICSLCDTCVCCGNCFISMGCVFGYFLMQFSFIISIVFILISIMQTQTCYTINGFNYAPFAYYFVKSFGNAQINDVAGSCLWGDGNYVGGMMSNINGSITQITDIFPNQLNDMYIAAAGVDDDGNDISSSGIEECGWPLFFKYDWDSSYSAVYSAYTLSTASGMSQSSVFDDSLTSSDSLYDLTNEEVIFSSSFDDVAYYTKNNTRKAIGENLSDNTTTFNFDLETTIADVGTAFYNTPLGLWNIDCDLGSTSTRKFVISDNCADLIASGAPYDSMTTLGINELPSDSSASAASFATCYDTKTWTESSSYYLYTANYIPSYDFSSFETDYNETALLALLRQGESDLEAYYDAFYTKCFAASGTVYSDVTSGGSPTTAQVQAFNAASLTWHWTLEAIQQRAYTQTRQMVYYNESATGESLPSTLSEMIFESGSVPYSTATDMATSDPGSAPSGRSDMRAMGFDHRDAWNGINTTFTDMLDGLDSLQYGLNCQIMLGKGLNHVMDSICASGGDNNSLMSTFVQISFYQLLVSVLTMFSICCGFCYKRYAIDNYNGKKIGVEDEDSD